MGLSVRCECGTTLPVDASEAGTTIVCRCQRSLELPRLSALRALAGSADDSGSVLERVRRQIERGDLPSNAICPITGEPATFTLWYSILCEREWARRTDAESGIAALFLIFGGWFGLLFAVLWGGRRELVGNNVLLEAPMRFSHRGSQRARSMRWQRSLKRTLATTSIYKELLRTYPQARVMRVDAEFSTLEGPGLAPHAGIRVRRVAR